MTASSPFSAEFFPPEAFSPEAARAFQALVYEAGGRARRSFPWREDTRPWGVLVSEIMLQQTTTARVEGYWPRWMATWPSPAALAGASLGEVLEAWSGLGYYNRARRLWECARVLAAAPTFPATPGELEKLPGVGPYTAGAVACFAFGYPALFIETNIRAVFLHHCFPGVLGVKDAELLPLLGAALDRNDPRRWYWTLMDYGAALKKSVPNPGRQSAHYARQSAFEGSFRQLRAAVLRELVSRGGAGEAELVRRFGGETPRALASLARDGLACNVGGAAPHTPRWEAGGLPDPPSGKPFNGGSGRPPASRRGCGGGAPALYD